jgi:rSAM/selenodomain-associated transferase 1
MPGLKRLVVVFLKLPTPGRVKTRLAASIGDDEAAMIYTELVRRTFAALPTEGSTIWLYAEPAARLNQVESWIDSLGTYSWRARARIVPQPDGDLGDRLTAVFRQAFAESYRHVIAVGTDCPLVTTGHFHDAFERLETTDAVIGPAMDGGYYLIGLRRETPELFFQIPWSSPSVFEATRSAAASAGLTTSILEPLRDVDSIHDWEAVKPFLK